MEEDAVGKGRVEIWRRMLLLRCGRHPDPALMRTIDHQPPAVTAPHWCSSSHSGIRMSSVKLKLLEQR